MDPDSDSRSDARQRRDAAVEQLHGALDQLAAVFEGPVGGQVSTTTKVDDLIGRLETIQLNPVVSETAVVLNAVRARAQLYRYFRQHHTNAEVTVSDVLQTLREGKIPEGVVRLWIEERHLNIQELEAVIAGYDQLKDRIVELGLLTNPDLDQAEARNLVARLREQLPERPS